MKSGVYQIVNTITGKVYIGSAINFAARWRQHLSLLRRGLHHSCKLQRSWIKHGEASFRFEVIELVAADDLLAREQAWMDLSRPFYNIAPMAGRQTGVKLSADTRRKMSKVRLGKSPSSETREKMSEWQRGRKRSEETCRRISESKKAANLKGRPPWNAGKTLSPETRAKLSLARKGKPTWFGEKMDEATKEKLRAARKAAMHARAAL